MQESKDKGDHYSVDARRMIVARWTLYGSPFTSATLQPGHAHELNEGDQNIDPAPERVILCHWAARLLQMGLLDLKMKKNCL